MFNLSKNQERIKSKKKGKWWLFNANDFQSLMYPCFTFCRILGIFPYKINNSSSAISKPYYILSIIIICAFCFYTLINMMNLSDWFDIRQNVHKTIEIYSFFVIGSFITIVTFILNRPRMRFLWTILKISTRLSSKVYQRQSVLIHGKDIFGFFFLLIYTIIDFYNAQVSIVTMLCPLYINVLVFQVDMLYINCVCVLKACFTKINDDLANVLIMYNEPHLIRTFCHNQRNSLLLTELKALKKRHLKISDSVQMLKIIFSPQLLATMASIFIHITFELYFNMVSWKNGLFISWTKYVNNNVVPYIVLYFIKLVLIIWACETGKNEAVKISTNVHDILNSTKDEQIKYELQLFSLQLMHCDNTFSAKGLSLDATRLTAVNERSFVTIV
ncbi:PREDICTED: putative gustatory receptor 28b [Wasmannia auropunctata]|uniref:putative gustatory receptor 28b n=1 Tax=Wasmannia auropunctata TaxID=64793 RepID=UPI0005ED6478|nr:PREDICTED: putative gustatory receptor 28b [Wasmannia auropunctata]